MPLAILALVHLQESSVFATALKNSIFGIIIIIGDDGAKSLAEGIAHCQDFRLLNLSYNQIGDEGAKRACKNYATLLQSEGTISRLQCSR